MLTEALNEQSPDSPVDQDMLSLMSEYAELSMRYRDANGEAEMLKDKMAQLEPSILEAMALNGVDNMRVKNLTLYRKTNFFVSKRGDVETQSICDLLRTHGLGYLVADGYSSAALKSKVKEWLDEGAQVPEQLAACLNVGEAIVLATRK